VSAAMVNRMPVEELAVALRRRAAKHGDWDRIAAVELIVAHESWLHRRDFRRYVQWETDGSGAWLDLAGLARRVDPARASTSEAAILRLACALVGAGPEEPVELPLGPWSVQAMLRPLGHANAALAAEAVRYAVLGPANGGAR
jgi:hypothetical protein